MTWLFSIIGLGGVGVALMFIPGAWELLIKIKSKIPVLGWVLVASLGFAAIQWGEARHWHKEYSGQVAGRAADVREVATKMTEAKAADQEHTYQTQIFDAKNMKEVSDALTVDLRAARAATADYIRLHPARQATARSGGAPHLPAATHTARSIDGTGQASVVPASDGGTPNEVVIPAADLDICTDAVLKAEGWRDLWLRMQATPR
jgi:hypothetical protein